MPARFPPRLVAAIDDGQILGVRAGTRAPRKFVRGFARKRRRDATLELGPREMR